jgi:hypothetical protein
MKRTANTSQIQNKRPCRRNITDEIVYYSLLTSYCCSFEKLSKISKRFRLTAIKYIPIVYTEVNGVIITNSILLLKIIETASTVPLLTTSAITALRPVSVANKSMSLSAVAAINVILIHIKSKKDGFHFPVLRTSPSWISLINYMLYANLTPEYLKLACIRLNRILKFELSEELTQYIYDNCNIYRQFKRLTQLTFNDMYKSSLANIQFRILKTFVENTELYDYPNFELNSVIPLELNPIVLDNVCKNVNLARKVLLSARNFKISFRIIEVILGKIQFDADSFTAMIMLTVYFVNFICLDGDQVNKLIDLMLEGNNFNLHYFSVAFLLDSISMFGHKYGSKRSRDEIITNLRKHYGRYKGFL